MLELFDLALVGEGAGGLDTVDHLGGGEGRVVSMKKL